MAEHLPVLRTTVIDLLDPKPGEVCVDATVGLGGHAAEIAQRIGQSGRLIGIDQDKQALEIAGQRIQGCNLELLHGNFSNIENILKRLGIAKVDKVLADIGVSSLQLDTAERGFSFRTDGPLDMRMDQTRGEPASSWIAKLSEQELATIFWEYGEERNSRKIAKAIVADRQRNPFRTTTQLAELIRNIVGRSKGGGPQIDPATRVFQALRIAVNDELGSLDAFLDTYIVDPFVATLRWCDRQECRWTAFLSGEPLASQPPQIVLEEEQT